MKNLDDNFDVLDAIQRVSNPPKDILRLIETQIQQEAKDREYSYRRTEALEELAKDSKNAIEQRDAIIRFMVERIINSEQTTATSKKELLKDILVPIAAVSSGTGDLVKLINDGLEIIS